MDAKQILRRPNLRGLVKCKACSHYNGIRATACKNKSCRLSKVVSKPKLKPKINSIQLVTKDESQLFSVQIRDRDVDYRNFVSVTDKVISSDASASIISRNAICYVDTCKYDSNDVNISCKHVKSSLESCTTKAKVQNIEEDILKRLQMTDEQRRKLLSWHRESMSESSATPLVQRINERVFVVCCDVSLNFPIGLLHAVCTAEQKGVRFCCACQKAKVLIATNQSTLMGQDICEHILLILAAIMSDLNLQKEFESLANIIKTFVSTTIDECQWLKDEVSSVPIATAYNDLGSTTIAATLVESLDNIELIQIPNALTEGEALNSSFFNLDQCSGESVDMENLPISVESENVPMNDKLNNGEYSDGLELVNYRVQLTDQFNVANKVEFGDEQLNAAETQNNLSIDGIYGLDDSGSTNDVVLSYLCSDGMLFEDLPMEVMNENLISNKDHSMESDDDIYTEHEKMCRSLDSTQLESYHNWLGSVIEATNLILDFNSDGYPEPLKFSVPHLYFDILRTKFSAGTKKKRLPNLTTVVTDGRYKNQTMSTWIFSNIKLIKYIFCTKTMELEVVRSFRKTSQNTFEYIPASELINSEDEVFDNNRKIRPTVYKTFLKMKSVDKNAKFQCKSSKQGLFIIEWIPNALPISKYGEMRIKLQYGHMKNDTVLQ
ncbi:uncharacterized protein C2orf42 homolog isoform X2 [Sitodiplosis mosellana]|uniref:uncharacterized protein C2orf42 homolog isoform X2 n=1 Tax=Sitodiplosis mosellana TaxID=263140 RepID=UPI0024440A6D|nr:uncharacterized protein C2orf42 homolog isoform X2 [Sitodiplosis mosellana]